MQLYRKLASYILTLNVCPYMWQTMGKFSPAKELNKLTFPLLVQKNKNKNKTPQKNPKTTTKQKPTKTTKNLTSNQTTTNQQKTLLFFCQSFPFFLNCSFTECRHYCSYKQCLSFKFAYGIFYPTKIWKVLTEWKYCRSLWFNPLFRKSFDLKISVGF